MFGPFGCLIHFSSKVLPGLKDHGTNAVKPPNASWSSRIASRWSSKSSVCSTWPYIIVAVDLNPRRWASRWTSSQVSGPPFFGSMRRRTRDEDLGAPARQRPLPRIPEPVEHVDDGEPAYLADGPELQDGDQGR